MIKKICIVLCALVLCCPAITSGVEQAGHSGTQLTLDDLRTFTDVFNLVRENYVDDVGDRTLLNSAITGMVSELDAHSLFMTPEEYRAQDDAIKGRYVGIGADVEVRDGRIVVVNTVENSAAFLAGVRKGDLITAIDGRSVRGRPIRESIEQLPGEPGSEVEVRFKTGNRPSRTLLLRREYIQIASVRSKRLDTDFGYFRITYFHRNSDEDFRSALDTMRSEHEHDLTGIVIDLRGNSGGVIGPAMRIADGFLEEGLIVYTRGRNEKSQLEYSAEPGEWTPGVPLVVLVDHQTASSSEILAGALQDRGRAVLVGETTFGKGTVQSVLELRNGSALKLTTARYFTPSGRMIDSKGIEPDVVIGPKRFAVSEKDDTEPSGSAVTLVLGTSLSDALAAINPASDCALAEALEILRNGGKVPDKPATGGTGKR